MKTLQTADRQINPSIGYQLNLPKQGVKQLEFGAC
jgi:hypothetical protein